MSTHTPTPWRANGGQIEGPKMALIVATVAPVGIGRAPRDEEEYAANTRLIATAPDLLAALKDLVDCHARFTGEPGHDCNVWAEADDRARAAISSAEGSRP